MRTWWDRATEAEKLAQIDAGIELGMTGKQIAMNLRAPVNAFGGSKVTTFARRHGRSFPYAASTKRKSAARIAGHHGGKVVGLLNARKRGIPETKVKTAYEIFGPAESQPFELDFLDAEESA